MFAKKYIVIKVVGKIQNFFCSLHVFAHMHCFCLDCNHSFHLRPFLLNTCFPNSFEQERRREDNQVAVITLTPIRLPPVFERIDKMRKVAPH